MYFNWNAIWLCRRCVTVWLRIKTFSHKGFNRVLQFILPAEQKILFFFSLQLVPLVSFSTEKFFNIFSIKLEWQTQHQTNVVLYCSKGDNKKKRNAIIIPTTTTTWRVSFKRWFFCCYVLTWKDKRRMRLIKLVKIGVLFGSWNNRVVCSRRMHKLIWKYRKESLLSKSSSSYHHCLFRNVIKIIQSRKSSYSNCVGRSVWTIYITCIYDCETFLCKLIFRLNENQNKKRSHKAPIW